MTLRRSEIVSRSIRINTNPYLFHNVYLEVSWRGWHNFLKYIQHWCTVYERSRNQAEWITWTCQFSLLTGI